MEWHAHIHKRIASRRNYRATRWLGDVIKTLRPSSSISSLVDERRNESRRVSRVFSVNSSSASISLAHSHPVVPFPLQITFELLHQVNMDFLVRGCTPPSNFLIFRKSPLPLSIANPTVLRSFPVFLIFPFFPFLSSPVPIFRYMAEGGVRFYEKLRSIKLFDGTLNINELHRRIDWWMT